MNHHSACSSLRIKIFCRNYISTVVLLLLCGFLLWLAGCRRASMAREDGGYPDLIHSGDATLLSVNLECVPYAGEEEQTTATIDTRLRIKGAAGPAEILVAVGFRQSTSLICLVDGMAVEAEQVAFKPDDFLRSAMDKGRWNALMERLPRLRTQAPLYTQYLLYFYIVQVNIPDNGEVALELHYDRPLTRLRENSHWGALRLATQSEWAFTLGGAPVDGVTTVRLDQAKGLRLAECSQPSQYKGKNYAAFRLEQTAGATFYARWEAETGANVIVVWGTVTVVLALAVLLYWRLQKKRNDHT